MCLSRFMLNLRAIGLAGNVPDSSLHLSRMSDVRFAKPSAVVGNLGAPLLADLDDHDLLQSPRGGGMHVSDEPMMAGYLLDIDR